MMSDRVYIFVCFHKIISADFLLKTSMNLCVPLCLYVRRVYICYAEMSNIIISTKVEQLLPQAFTVILWKLFFPSFFKNYYSCKNFFNLNQI